MFSFYFGSTRVIIQVMLGVRAETSTPPHPPVRRAPSRDVGPPYHVAKRAVRILGRKLDVGRREDLFFLSSPDVWGKIERWGPGR